MSMLKKSKQGYYFFEEFGKFKDLPAGRQGLIHGISSRKFDGEKLLAALELKKENLVLMEQVHGDRIKVVSEIDKGKIIPRVDGLITSAPGVILGVKTADCLPVIFYDPQAKIIGICHVGWRGVLAKIIQKMVDLMILAGGSPHDLAVGVGPHIGGCCYTVDKTRPERFLAEFGKLENMVYADEKGTHLELSVPVLIQLLNSGLKRENIFVPLTCTSCQNKEFFSFRKDKKETRQLAGRPYGEMLTVIGLKV